MNLYSHPIETLKGEIICPGDKSISQRILIIGSLLNSDILVKGFLNANDPNSTLNALNEIGASIEKVENRVYLKKRSIPFFTPKKDLDLGNSGTGLRLMLGLISGLGINANMTGDISLSKRPMNRVITPLKEMGANISSNNGKLPIKISTGKIVENYDYQMPIASAQVKSCLILAALASRTNIKIHEPKVTRDHTERIIEYFDGKINYGQESREIKFSFQELKPSSSYNIVGDISSASFVIVATVISQKSEVLIKNVGLNNTRSGLIKVLSLMGAHIEVQNRRVECNENVGDIFVKSSTLKGINIPEEIIPNIIDEIPILSIAASFALGTTNITNASELRVKESDRLNAISEGLTKIGAEHKLFEDGISIYGSLDTICSSIKINSYGDHRIAMSFLVAGIRSNNGIKVENCKNIETSFPHFKETMNLLGANIIEE